MPEISTRNKNFSHYLASQVTTLQQRNLWLMTQSFKEKKVFFFCKWKLWKKCYCIVLKENKENKMYRVVGIHIRNRSNKVNTLHRNNFSYLISNKSMPAWINMLKMLNQWWSKWLANNLLYILSYVENIFFKNT